LAYGRTAVQGLALLICLVIGACGPGNPQKAVVSEAPTVAAPGAIAVKSTTLAAVRQRRRLNCGVHEPMPGFAEQDARGVWRGFDVDFCRAVAAAVLGDARLVTFLPQTVKDRFAALQTGQVDLLSAGAAWTFTRDAGLPVDFVGVAYYDSQGLLARGTPDLATAAQLRGKRVCVEAASAAAENLAEFNRTSRLRMRAVPLDSDVLARQTYEAGGCDAISADISVLAAYRSLLADPAAHVILGESLSRAPRGPSVRDTDPAWEDIVRWTLNALILAEELGITSQTVQAARRRPATNEVERLLVGDGNGRLLGLRDDWAFEAIRQVGNYGEVFERNLGPQTPLGLQRGSNALASSEPQGLLYALPMR